jgi:hypothetical protein
VAVVSAVDLHPEELLDRARRGAASPDEWQRLRAHLVACPACRFERVLAEDSARAEVPVADDAQLLARVRRGAARAVYARGGAFATRTPSWSRRRPTRFVYAAAALVVFAATLAAATTVVRRVWRGPEIEQVDAPARTARARHHMAANASATAPSTVPSTADEADVVAAPVAAAPTQDDPAQGNGLMDDAEARRAPAHVARARQVASADAPGELFARANAARRAGQTREASRLYRQLQREFPGSSEELVSRVTLGRWMLDRLDDPSGALARFDSYLANPVHTALREEALIGRALALGRLGRQAEERGAWTAFLAAFPGSVYAERARGRLEILR